MARQFRFIDSANRTVGGRHYDIQSELDEIAWCCDTTGPALNETINFYSADGGIDFTLVPKRRIMNRSFTLHEGESDGTAIAELKTHGIGFEWKVRAPGGAERFRIVDPTGKIEATLRFLFEGFTHRYAVLAEKQIVGNIEREPRPEREGLPGGFRGLVRRVFKDFDWVLTLESNDIDIRQAVAAVMLLIELQIRGKGGLD